MKFPLSFVSCLVKIKTDVSNIEIIRYTLVKKYLSLTIVRLQKFSLKETTHWYGFGNAQQNPKQRLTVSLN